MKYLIGFAFAGILGALVLAGVFMMRDGRGGKPKSGGMMRALALRVALSVLLFACIPFVAITALNSLLACEPTAAEIGDKAKSLPDKIAGLQQRYDSYLPRLIERLSENAK